MKIDKHKDQPKSMVSLAVTPFDNLTGDVEQDYFSRGFVEDLIIDLSRFPNLQIISSHSSLSQNAKKSAGLKTNPFVNRNSRMTHQQSGQAAMPFWGLHRKCWPIIKLNNVKHLNGILFFFGRRLLSCRRPLEALRQALHGFFGNLQIANLCFAKNGRRNIWSIFRGFNDYGV